MNESVQERRHRPTRRSFLRSSSGAACSMFAVAAGKMLQAVQDRKSKRLEGYKGTAPSAIMTELDETRLLAATEGPSGVISKDGGRTWSKPFRFLQGGKPLEGSPFPGRSLVRLQSGELGMVYSKQQKGPAQYALRSWFFASSSDEGNNWSEGAPVDLPAAYDIDKGIYVQYLWGTLRQLSSGRLLCPGYWYMGGRHPEVAPMSGYPAHGLLHGQRIGSDGHLFEAAMGGCFCYFSDDRGKSWSRSTGSVMVWPLPGEEGIGGFGATWEPVIVELKDHRILMFVRTNVGRIFQSLSSDGGDHWSLAQPTDLASGDVPCCLGRLRTTGDLLVIWNQASSDEVLNGYSRGRLSLAISKDEGKSWGNFTTVERSAGMEEVDRVQLPPVKHVRPKIELGILPDNYARHHYPKLAFVQEKAVMTYQSDTFPYGKRVREITLFAVPEEKLYR